MPYAKLFRSRWAALLWAAGILWTAVDVAGYDAPDTSRADNGITAAADATDMPVDNDDLATLAQAMNGN